jgi:putative membrane protein
MQQRAPGAMRDARVLPSPSPLGAGRPSVISSRRDPDRPPAGEDAPSLDESGRRLVYLAAERTLLTWARAAIALIVLGFAVDRFGLLLARGDPVGLRGALWSSWLGLALIGIGVAASIVSALHYRHFLRRYREGDTTPGPGIPLALGLVLLLALAGVGMAVYLGLASAQGCVGGPVSGSDALEGARHGATHSGRGARRPTGSTLPSSWIGVEPEVAGDGRLRRDWTMARAAPSRPTYVKTWGEWPFAVAAGASSGRDAGTPA